MGFKRKGFIVTLLTIGLVASLHGPAEAISSTGTPLSRVVKVKHTAPTGNLGMHPVNMEAHPPRPQRHDAPPIQDKEHPIPGTIEWLIMMLEGALVR